MDTAIELKNVSIVRNGRYILKSLNLNISKGENVAIIGPNGSGKTTLIKLFRGCIYPYYDEKSPAVMRIFGQDKWNISNIQNRIGIVSMDVQNMFRDDTKVQEVICSGLFNSLDIFRNHIVTRDMIDKVHEYAMIMGIINILDMKIDTISLGEMRRALIARALIIDPDILILDEPMTGLDIIMKSKFRSMFDILISRGVSIILITHDLSDIPSSIRRVVMIKNGEIFADGIKEDLLVDSKVSKLYSGSVNVGYNNGIYYMYPTNGVI